MPTIYLIKTDTIDGPRWLGPALGLVRKKAEAREFDDLDTVCRQIALLQRMFPHIAYGMDKQDEAFTVGREAK